MTGNTWIIIGVISAALAAFSIPYGFYRKSKEHSETSPYVAGDYVKGDKVKAEGDYVKGDKVEINKTTKVGGDFTQITNFLGSGSTGVFVNLVLNVADFVGDRNSIVKSASLDDYLKWLKKPVNQNLFDEQRNLLDAAGRKDEQAMLVRASIEKVILQVEAQKNKLKEIVEQTKLLPDMNSKLDYLVNQLDKNDSSGLHKGQLAISAKVLDILTKGVVGSGVKVMMERGGLNIHEGTAMFAWLLGSQSPHMMLLDIVGDIDRNRISLILNEDASIGLRAYDGDGHKTEVKSGNYPPGHYLVIHGVWKDRNISLWVNGEFQGSSSMTNSFDYLGPACFFGIDIEGKLSADAVRWTPQDQQEVGLNFRRNGIWHGSRFDTAILWNRVLEKSEIETLAKDPFAMFRPRTCKNGKCPDCGSPVAIDKNRNARKPDERIKRLDGSRVPREYFEPSPPAVWCVCTKCGRPCLSQDGFPE